MLVSRFGVEENHLLVPPTKPLECCCFVFFQTQLYPNLLFAMSFLFIGHLLVGITFSRQCYWRYFTHHFPLESSLNGYTSGLLLLYLDESGTWQQFTAESFSFF